MSEYSNYHRGLLYMIHLLISADNVIDEGELRALEAIQKLENMPLEIYRTFIKEVDGMEERKIYEKGIDMISLCTEEEQIKAFSWLLKISESDGQVHAKEVRFLFYSAKKAGIGINDVIEAAKKLPSLS
ncbi:MAG: hypothetical protein OEW75_05375 [Cyclobacteriaceae bacterium]|nr:hypothetical protein [Cyclobacteriaceae bacterium]